MAGTTLVHVGVCVSDLEQVLRFWRDGLGLRVAASTEICCCYDLTDGYHNVRVFAHRGPARSA